MKYIYDKMQNGYSKDPCRLSTTTSFDSITDSDVTFPRFVVVHSGHNEQTPLKNPDDLAGWRVKLEREFVWKDKPKVSKDISETKTKDAINPSHHQGTIVVDDVIELQWLEHLQYHVRYKNHPERFKGAVELQIRKYMDRNGGKDSELQETLKALWYMKFLAAYIKNGNKPIFVKDIDKILEAK